MLNIHYRLFISMLLRQLLEWLIIKAILWTIHLQLPLKKDRKTECHREQTQRMSKQKDK